MDTQQIIVIITRNSIRDMKNWGTVHYLLNFYRSQSRSSSITIKYCLKTKLDQHVTGKGGKNQYWKFNNKHIFKKQRFYNLKSRQKCDKSSY